MFCHDCDYNLQGCAGQTCPECGRAFDPEDSATYQAQLHGPWSPGPKMRRFLKGVAVLCWSYPLLLLTSLYLTWFVAWGALGHRPRPSLDDPKYIAVAVDLCYGVTMVVFMGFPAAFMLGFSVIGMSVYGNRRSALRTALLLLLYLALWTGTLLYMRHDPARVGEWFMD